MSKCNGLKIYTYILTAISV